jgi:hypothetical protein
MLIPFCQGSPTRTSTDTEYQLHFGGIQDSHPRTGSSNNFACNIGKNAISNAITKFPRVTNTTERSLTSNTSCNLAESKIAVCEAKAVITLIIL